MSALQRYGTAPGDIEAVVPRLSALNRFLPVRSGLAVVLGRP
jgi:hypothetical protein